MEEWTNPKLANDFGVKSFGIMGLMAFGISICSQEDFGKILTFPEYHIKNHVAHL